jgi:hypothetical protein
LFCDELKNTKHSKKKEDIFEALKRSLLDTKEDNSRLSEENQSCSELFRCQQEAVQTAQQRTL